jgi:hypothetical protein
MSLFQHHPNKGHDCTLSLRDGNCKVYYNYRLSKNKFHDFVDCIYSIELDIKDGKDRENSASYLDLHIDIESKTPLRANFFDI